MLGFGQNDLNGDCMSQPQPVAAFNQCEAINEANRQPLDSTHQYHRLRTFGIDLPFLARHSRKRNGRNRNAAVESQERLEGH